MHLEFAGLATLLRGHFVRNLLLAGTTALLIGCSGGSDVNIDYNGPTADWPNYGSADGGGHFSAATQITPENVVHLQKAWEYRSGHVLMPGEGTDLYPTGDEQPDLGSGWQLPDLGSGWQLTPLLVNDTLYGCSAFNRMFALDPQTGEELWSVDPKVDPHKEVLINCRGVSSWQGPANQDGICAHRIFMGTMDGRLLAVDGGTGESCTDFGDNGTVDLKAGLGEHAEFEFSSISPAAVLGNKLIMGSMILDRLQNDMPSGVVRAFDVRSGELVWYWDPVPPGETTELDADGQPVYRRGTTNVWSIISVDEERNLVFLPTGNTSTDFFGGLRDNLDYYSSAVVALNGSTGEVVWHFQMVHHDIWDYDTPAQPTLFEFERDGEKIPALAQPTKMGHLFLLNRETGEPLFPVEERPVPQGGEVAGEYLSPTQPFPTKPAPLHPARLDPEDAWGFTFWDKGACRKQIESLKNEGIFTPPSIQGSLFFPSDFGGNNWGTPAVDLQRNIAVLNTRLLASVLKLTPREECRAAGGGSPQLGTPYCVEVTPILSPLGAPCNAPPWGTLAAVDLNTGEKIWETPLGTLKHIAPWPVSLMAGPPNIGGAAVTASGLTFIGSSTDQYLRAFDTETGEELWKAPLPTGGHATPMTYRAGPDQKQYVVITAGGHYGMAAYGQKPSDHLIAFALPD
jgi:quinoprotein glucose dehydrogenase